MSLSIIIPARNEKENLPIILKRIKETIQNYDYEIIIIKAINDDSDKHINLDDFKNISVIEQNKKGYGAALKEGFKNSNKENLCIFNADGSFETKDILRLISELENNNDFVFCSRYLKGAGSEDDNITTFIGNYIFSFIGRFFFKLKLSDILYTYFITKTNKIKKLNLLSDDFSICVEIPIKMKRFNFNYNEIPSFEFKRMFGKKNVNEFKDGFLILIKMIRLFLKIDA